MFKGIHQLSLAACLISTCYVSTAQDQSPSTSTDTKTEQQNAGTRSPVEVQNRMNMDEPMQGGMRQKGMKKRDVEKSAEKKDEEMKKVLEMEEKLMPPTQSTEPKM